MTDINKTRNFCIIAHIDHGKSTLADRILEYTGAVDKRKMKEQYLDTMDIERERGITIKSVAIKLDYKAKDGETYIFNLIDTPGHVDFTYEVSRSLAACEGAILIVDATQGVEAQTLANVYLAIESDLEILPVINKIDLPSADVENVKEEIENIIGIDTDNAVLVSAKTGVGIEELLESIIEYLPSPEEDNSDNKLRALIFDAKYDAYKGVIVYLRVMTGSIKEGEEVKFLISDKIFQAIELGVFRPEMSRTKALSYGDVGYFISNIKDVRDIEIGDTITNSIDGETIPLAGYKELKPVVFAGVYPQDNDDYELLKEALYKLKLNDAAIIFENENSEALGHGFRTGFLGLLHMEIVQERLEREFGLNLIFTAPSVKYRVTRTNGEAFWMDNPVMFPPTQEVEKIEEPYIDSQVITPQEYIGRVMDLCKEKRGEFVAMDYIDARRVNIKFIMPLAEIVIDFYDKLKSRTQGYASYEYEITGYKKSTLIKLDILVNGKVVDALSCIVHRDFAEPRGREIVAKLKDLIPRHLFKIPLQAAIGGKIVARETIAAMRKNVLAKCYGGDISRKRKLLDKQKAGKKRMKLIGDVEIPQSAFINVLKLGDN